MRHGGTEGAEKGLGGVREEPLPGGLRVSVVN
jgi:hypothetical protein